MLILQDRRVRTKEVSPSLAGMHYHNTAIIVFHAKLGEETYSEKSLNEGSHTEDGASGSNVFFEIALI